MHSGKRRNDGRAQVQDSCVIYGDSLDPISPEVRISETGVCGPTPAQRQSDLVQAAPALDVVHQALNPQIRKPNRRPFNLYAFCNNAAATSPSFTDAGISALSYRDALMAGNHGHGHGRAFSGRGAPPWSWWSPRLPWPCGTGKRTRLLGGQYPTATDAGRAPPPLSTGVAGCRGGPKPIDINDSSAASEGAAVNAPRPGAGRDGDQRALGGGRGHGDDIDARGQAAGNVLDDEQGKQKRKRKDQPLKLVCTICSEEHYTNQCPQL